MDSMLNNKNAEIWTFEEAKDLFNKANDLAKNEDYDFIGEIASELDTYREVFVYLRDKFPELLNDYRKLTTKLEANCFSHSKKGLRKEATAIMNLKSNYHWTDRTDLTTKGNEVKNKDLSEYTTDELIKRAETIRELNGKT